MRSPLAIAKSLLGGAEGSWRGPFTGIGERGNSFVLGPIEDGFQRNLQVQRGDYHHTAISCAMVIARLLSAAWPNHHQLTDKGGRRVVTSSQAHQLLMRPNPAQNVMDFVTWIVLQLCFTGNAYFYVRRNDRNEPVELIPLGGGYRAFLGPDSTLFYDVSVHADFSKTLDIERIVPARDVLHIKLPSRRSVLHGDSLIGYAYGPMAVSNAIQGSAASFSENMNRPSGIISTEQALTASQMTELRAKFDEVSRGMNQGKVPILGFGMKFQPMAISAGDSQMLEQYNASVLDICRIFGVPIQLLGLESNGAASSISALIGQFKVGSLLYFCELIEFSLEELFKFDHRHDTIRFDIDNISRADFASEIDTLAKAVQNTVFSPNEARNRVGNDSVEFGDEPRIQAQNVRLEDAKPQASAGKPMVPEKPEPVESNDDKQPLAESKFADTDYVSTKLSALIKNYRKDTA